MQNKNIIHGKILRRLNTYILTMKANAKLKHHSLKNVQCNCWTMFEK
jgi:hypothetical protein